MFFFRHPQPIVDGRALVVQMVRQQATRAVSRTLLIVDKPVQPEVAPVPVEHKQA